MRVLLTGATGLIGKEVGKRLIERGHVIHAVSRDAERARMELPFPARIFSWAGGDAEFPSEALEDVGAIVHLAGESIAPSGGRWTDGKKREMRDSRILGTRSLVRAIRKDGAKALKVFVQGSAVGIYGDRGDELLTDTAVPGADFLARLVEDWEAEAAPLKEIASVRVAFVRTGLVLSRRGGMLAKLLPVFARGVGGKIGNGQQWMSWIHIDDIAEAFVFAITHADAKGVLNAAAPEPSRNDRFSMLLARALGRSVFLPVPEAAMKTAMGEASILALGSQRVAPTRLQELGFEFRFSELVPALEELCEPLRGGQHELVSEQWLPRSPEQIFPFFSDEKNLERITPPFLGFQVISKSTGEIGEGTLIDYRLSVHGIPMKWRTQIETWNPSKRFVDTQLKGPYRLWKHTHDFVPFAGGTLMRDRVLYKLPLGFFGDTVAGWKVSRDVDQIFAFRRKVIDAKFGSGAEA